MKPFLFLMNCSLSITLSHIVLGLIRRARVCSDDVEQALSWEDRIQIALDISHGIDYLHDGVG